MNTFDIIILEFFLSLTPILFYFICCFFAKTLDKDKNNLALDLALVSSFYLLVRLNNIYINRYPIIFLDALLIIAFLKKRKEISILLSFMLVVYYKNNFDINIYYLIIEYAIFYILSITSLINKKYLFSNILITIKGLMYIIYFKNSYIILTLLMFYILMNLVVYLFLKMNEVMNLFRDITDIEKEKRLVSSLFKITHEIKNPIAVCKGYLDMFDVRNIEHSKKYIPIIKSEINRTLTLLEDFLSISKIKIDKDIMDVNYLLEDTIASLKPIINNKNVVVSFNITDDEVFIMADYNRLKQTLINIIKNSIESIDKSGHIKIYTKLTNKHIEIFIEDNGEGMNKEELSKIKEAFFTTKEKGTGLGIYLSNEIIKEHNGTLLYDSIKGIGTTVTISLPLN